MHISTYNRNDFNNNFSENMIFMSLVLYGSKIIYIELINVYLNEMKMNNLI